MDTIIIGLSKKSKITTLIDEFRYPMKGPGQMWNAAKELVEKRGGNVQLNSRVIRLKREGNQIKSVLVNTNGASKEVSADHFLSILTITAI